MSRFDRISKVIAHLNSLRSLEKDEHDDLPEVLEAIRFLKSEIKGLTGLDPAEIPSSTEEAVHFLKTLHRRIYTAHFGLGPDDFAPCEVTGGPGSDVHHIFGRVKCEAWDRYGITHADDINNLMFLSRDVHQWAGQNELYNEWLMKVHLGFLDDGITGFARQPYAEESRKLLQLVIEKNRI